MRIGFWRVAAGAALAVVASGLAAVVPAGAGVRHATAKPVSRHAASRRTDAPAKPVFGHEVVVDAQRVTGEPSLAISPTVNSQGHHEIYVSTPNGFATTESYVWRSEDGGQTFHLVPGNLAPFGKPLVTCVGGGDSSIVTDTKGNLYFADLQGLTNVSDSVSTNQGAAWVTTCNAANEGVDRPWITTYKDPLTTGREYLAVDDVDQCTYPCGLGQAGSNLLTLTWTGGTEAQAQVFEPLPAQNIEPDGIVGGDVVNQSNGDLYIAHTALTNAKGQLTGGGDANGNDNAVVVDRFPHGYSQTIATPIPPTSVSLCKPYNTSGPCDSYTAFHAPLDASGNSTVTVGQDFSPIAIDKAGNLYVTWAQAPVNASGTIDGPSTIYLAVSADQGATWSKPINVSAHVPGLKTNVFPWVAAGKDGAVDLVWYGTSTLGKCKSSGGCGSSNITGSWNVYLAESLNAVVNGKPNNTPTFATTKVTEYPNHYGAICTFGIGCSTGGDRGLLDFIQVQVEPSGAADVVWADSANQDAAGGTSSATIAFAHQVGGPGLYGGTISSPKAATNCANGSPDSYFSGDNEQNAAPKQFDIQYVCMTGPNAKDRYIVTMKVTSLSSLSVPPTLTTDADTDAVWLVRWEWPTRPAYLYHLDQGQVPYVAMESDLGGTPTFYAGKSATISAPEAGKQGFFLTYPGPGGPNSASARAIKGSYTKSGLITFTVPAWYVGNWTHPPQLRTLYSVTGITATQNQPAETGTAVFDQIDATAPFDHTP